MFICNLHPEILSHRSQIFVDRAEGDEREEKLATFPGSLFLEEKLEYRITFLNIIFSMLT